MKPSNEIEAVEALKEKYHSLKREISKVIVGQETVVDHVVNAIFAGGHCLLVGVPGLAKTLLVNTVAKSLELSFNRIQFTPDLMPGDITGNEILDEKKEFRFVKGPVFANIVLADEINRTPPKTQAALLESMQEKMVTVSGKKYPLPSPFFVLATQNPIEQEGTYPLPEAQLDRFMYLLLVDYPSFEEEVQIVKATTGHFEPDVKAVMNSEDILYYQQLVKKVPVPDNVIEYAVGLAVKTRVNSGIAPEIVKQYVAWGAGPRASQFLILGAKVHALLNGKYSPDIEDVKAIALPVLRHRVIRNYKAEAEGVQVDTILREIL
ncbi:MAG: ATPase AAA [Vicingaceae bacterium]|nr:MAG: ATPase AAA [Vicingaceae bacterium]